MYFGSVVKYKISSDIVTYYFCKEGEKIKSGEPKDKKAMPFDE